MPVRYGIVGGSGKSRPVKNPVGTTGLAASLSALVVTVLALFDVDPEVVQGVGAGLSALVGVLAAVVFRQPPAEPPADE